MIIVYRFRVKFMNNFEFNVMMKVQNIENIFMR